MKKLILLIHVPIAIGIIGMLSANSANAQWQQTSLSSEVILSLASDGTNIFAGGQVDVFLSTNNGVLWTAVDSGIAGVFFFSLAISPNGAGDTNIFAGSFNAGVFLSTNNGANWTALNTGFSVNTYVQSFAISDTNIFAGTDDGGVFLSTNNGTNWTAMNTGLLNSNVKSLAIKGDTIFAGTYGSGMFLSTNNGSSWTAVNTGLTNLNVISLAIRGGNIFAGTGGGVFLSTNNGANWTGVNTGLPANIGIRSFAISGSNIFAGANEGAFLSTNNGTNWTAVNTGLPTNAGVLSLAVSGTNIFAGNAQGVWKRPLSDFVTGIEDDSDNLHFVLYPNPSNGKFAISNSAGINSIVVCNVLGETVCSTSALNPVRTTVQSGGHQSLTIDISSHPKGIYFVKVITEKGETFAEKIILQ